MSGGHGHNCRLQTQYFFLNYSHLITSTIINFVGKKLEFANSLCLGQVHVRKLGRK